MIYVAADGNDNVIVPAFHYNENRFPDGTLNIDNFLWENIISVQSYYIYWLYEDDSEMFAIYCLKHFFDEHLPNKDRECSLLMPYVPNGRMDRVEKPHDVFTLKYFCKFINSLNFDYVIIEDPHSNVSPALLDRCRVRNCDETIESLINYFYTKDDAVLTDDVLLFYPDEGSAKKYSKLISAPYTYGHKIRDWETHRITSFELAEPNKVKDKCIIIVDDICSYGGTANNAAKALMEAGAKEVNFYVTFAESSILKGSLPTSDYLRSIYIKHNIGKWTTEDYDKCNNVGGPHEV